MPKINPKIKSIDDLLRIDAEFEENQAIDKNDEQEPVLTNSIVSLPILKIRMFKNHPFRLYEGERLDDMAESIKANGVLVPAIVRTIEADETGYKYEMLAGHNRLNAARIAGLDELPCIVKENLSDEDALIYVVETNVLQRSFADMLPSEKATALSLRYSKMFSQGKRNDIIAELKMLENPQYIRENSTSSLLGTKLRSDEKLGIEYSLSRNTVARLLRLDQLTSELKHRMDDAEIGIYPAVNLSYLSEPEQQMVESILSDNEFKVDIKKAELLRSYSGKLNDDIAYQILSGEKNKKTKNTTPPPVKIKHKIYSKYFPADTKAAEIEKIVDEALELYFTNRQKKGAE